VKRGLPVFIALALLVFGACVDGWDWWTTHDLEVLGLLSRAPVVGRSIESTLGADDQREQVVLAVDASYPPFASLQPDGSMVGFEVDLASELGQRLADKPRLVNMDAGDALFDALASKKVDAIIAGLTYYPEVTRDVVYSDPYFEAGPVLLARTGRSDISGASDLAGKRVAVELGSLGEEEARKLQKQETGMVVVPMDDVERVIASAGDGTVDAAVVDRPAIPPDSMKKAGLRTVGSPLCSHPYLVAVQRTNRSLLLAINKNLDAMKVDGSLATIERKWFP
jgi:ABC-type amino acid transport substrate-binding protein